MKKVAIILVLLLAFAVCLTACNKNDPAPASDPNPVIPRPTEYVGTQYLPPILSVGGFSDSNGGDYLAANRSLLQSVYASQEEYLLGLQTANGGFKKWSKDDFTKEYVNEINPYFSCFVAIALLENPDNAAAVKKYLLWHISKLNLTKDVNRLKYTIYDYYVKADGSEVSKGDYDSTDSYAAMFLSAVYKYYAVTGDTAFLTANKNTLKLVASVMNSTMKNNLTLAKPGSVKYTMDNSEVYAGFVAMEKICAEGYGDETLAATYYETANKVKFAIRSNLYKDGHFLAYEGKIFSHNTFYADNACQVYPAIYGVVEPASVQAQSAYATLNKNFPDWKTVGYDSFPWAILCYGSAVYGDYDKTVEYISYVNGKYIATNAYPWYCLEGAMTMLTASALLSA